jgi:hypothetical protein
VPDRPKIPKQVQVELSEELALDLAAFSAAHYDAQYAPILRTALRDHIDRSLDAEPARRRAFDDARAGLIKKPTEPISLVGRDGRRAPSLAPQKSAKQ